MSLVSAALHYPLIEAQNTSNLYQCVDSHFYQSRFTTTAHTRDDDNLLTVDWQLYVTLYHVKWYFTLLDGNQ